MLLKLWTYRVLSNAVTQLDNRTFYYSRILLISLYSALMVFNLHYCSLWGELIYNIENTINYYVKFIVESFLAKHKHSLKIYNRNYITTIEKEKFLRMRFKI